MEYLHNEGGLMSGSFNNDSRLFAPWTHPTWSLSFDGFIVDRYINSQPNSRCDEGSPDVAHSAAPGNIPGISKPGVPVWDYINFPQAMIAAANKGKGWHLMTAVEWAIIAEWSRINGTMPHGGNASTNPPSDSSYPLEIGQLDQHLHAGSPGNHRPLPGISPNTWSHNHQSTGIWDLNGCMLEWVMGLVGTDSAWTTDGYPKILAKIDLKYLTSAFGRGTVSGSGGGIPTITCDDAGVNWLKTWTVNEFQASPSMYVYIAEANSGAGGYYEVDSNAATTLRMINGSDPGNGTATFFICKLVSVDITSGMSSGNRILTLRDTDADLKPFAIPLTSDGTGSDTYGKDGYWFLKTGEVAATRGGSFDTLTKAGVFCLVMYYLPTYSGDGYGFRACKCL